MDLVDRVGILFVDGVGGIEEGKRFMLGVILVCVWVERNDLARRCSRGRRWVL